MRKIRKHQDKVIDIQFLRRELDKFGSTYLTEVGARHERLFLDNKQGYTETVFKLQGFLDMANGNRVAPDPKPEANE